MKRTRLFLLTVGALLVLESVATAQMMLPPPPPGGYGRGGYRYRPYPVYVPYGVPQQPAQGIVYTMPRPQDTQLPHASGALRTPPPGAALILVQVPEQFTPILFDGAKTTSVGTTRYYVTPELPMGKASVYTVTAVVNRNGQPVNEERQVSVSPGQSVTLDFTRPAK
ncbi:MAG: TIGR03000 domain-containing protein [Planctomycetia bacterium]|nr:TIGR03000 domain-containing protein [Planctomycetia bacterium]